MRSLRLLTCMLAISAALLLNGALAQSNVSLSLLGTWPEVYRSPATVVAVSGTCACVVLDTPTLVLFDVADPAHPVRHGQVDLDGWPNDAVIDNGYCYVASGEMGLMVVDVRDPDHPALVGTWDSPGYANALVVSNGLAYLADQDEGLHVLSVTNPASPTRLGGHDTAGSANDVCLMGNYAIVADDSSGIAVLDVSVPANVVLTGAANAGTAEQVALAGNHVIVGDSDLGLLIYNLSTPASPAYVTDCPSLAYVERVAASGSYAYAAGYAGTTLFTVDISNPTNPVVVSTNDLCGELETLTLAGSKLWIAEYEDGVELLDLTQPASPVAAGSIETSGSAQSAVIAGRYAYLADGSGGLRVLDLATGTNPVEVARTRLAEQVLSVAWVAPRLYVGGETLHVLDVSSATNPVILGSTPYVNGQTRLIPAGHLLFGAGYSSYLSVTDVGNPLLPFPAAGYRMDGFGGCLAVEGQRAFVADQWTGLEIIDITNPLAPAPLSTCVIRGFPLGLAVSNGRAYVPTAEDGLQIFDVSNPTNAIRIGVYRDAPFPQDVAIVGNLAIAATGEGLDVVDVRDPGCPVRVWRQVLRQWTSHVTVAGNQVIALCEYGGIVVLRLEIPGAPVILRQPASTAVEPGWTAVFDADLASTAPVAFQWFKGAAAIVGATNRTLVISNAAPGNAGVYWLAVTNATGWAVSSNATLALMSGAGPVFATQPSNTAVHEGNPAEFWTCADGTPPIFHQWRLNGTNIPGATSWELILPNAVPASAGQYSVVASNAWGTATSSNASLRVLTLGDALDQPAWTWTTGGTGDADSWLFGSSVTHDGVDAAESGYLSDSEESWIQTTVTGPGLLGFWWSVSSYYGDQLILSIDGEIIDYLEGSQSWWPEQVFVSAGSHVIRWTYAKNGDGYWNGYDQGWVDQVSFQATDREPVITRQPKGGNATYGQSFNASVTVTGAPPHAFQWRLDQQPLSGATNRSYTVSYLTTNHSGTYSVMVSNAFGSVLSSNAVLTVAAPLSPANSATLNSFFCWIGTNLSLSPTVSGTSPLLHQWLLDGTNLPGRTGTWLPLNNLGQTNAGRYSLFSSNAWGTITTDMADLEVVTPESLGEALDAHELPWTSASDVESRFVWHAQTNNTADGIDAARGWISAPYRDGYSTYLKTVVVGPGRLSFWWKCSVYTNFSKGEFHTNGTLVTPAITGVIDWREQVLNLAPGTNLLQWRYYQYTPYGIANPYSNSVWVDQVRFTPSVAAPTIVVQPRPATTQTGGNASFSVTAISTNSLFYQWLFEGSPVDGATNASLNLGNLTTLQAGNYSVIVSNPSGLTASSNALLSVHAPVAPGFSQHPQGLTALEGREVVFQGAATGSLPISYQWRRDGIDLPGATNTTLVFPNAASSQIGAYTLVASNAFGFNISSNAPLVLLTLGEALDAPHLAWTTGGSTNWAVTVTNTADGVDAAQNMRVNSHGQNSWIETTVAGPGGLSFWWKVSSYANATYLTFLTNGYDAAAISGEVNWTRRTCLLGPGTHTLRWYYYQSYFSGQNCGWVDRVDFTPSTSAPAILEHPADLITGLDGACRFSVTAFATEPFACQWLHNSTNLPGQTNATLTLTHLTDGQVGTYSVLVSNSAGAVVSSNATLSFSTLADALDTTNLVWSTGGDALWYPQTTVHFDGTDSAQSGLIQDNQTTWLETTVYGPGTLYFRWCAQSDGVDQGQLLVNGTTNTTIHGNASWIYRSVSLASGPQVLRWRYIKDSAGSSQSDCIWLDSVNWQPSATAPTLTLSHTNLTLETGDNATFASTVSGSHPLLLEWRFKGQTMAGATNTSLSLSNVSPAEAGQYSVVASNAYGCRTNSATLSVWPPSVPILVTPPVGGTIETRDAFQFSAEIEGSVPVAWQWLRNGLPIPGATTNTWLIASATTNDSADYSVMVSNRFGSTRAAPVSLNVLAQRMPQIVTNPVSQTALEGGEVRFTVLAAGTPPLACQWILNHSPFDGANASSLLLTNLTPALAGAWSVVVTNDFGAITSSIAMLTIIDIGLAVNAPHLAWTNSGNVPWLVITNDAHDGHYAARSGAIGNSQQSWIETQAEGPSVLSFWSLASSQTNSDVLELSTNGVAVSATRLSGLTGWVRQEVVLSDPTNILRWTYAKNGSYLENEDCARLDEVAITPFGPAPIILTQPRDTNANTADDVLLTVQAVATEAFVHQWRFGGIPIPGETNAALLLHGVTTNESGSYSVVVSNLHGTVISSNAQVVVRPPIPPDILVPPRNISVLEGLSATFSLTVTGTPPLAFQWHFNGVPITNATNLSLTVPSVTPANAGSYVVTVSSSYGTTNSPAAVLAILSLAEALDAPSLVWTSSASGGGTWYPQSANTHDGVDAARSGSITHGANTFLETTVIGPGTLTFWWSVSSEGNYDFLEFHINGTLQSGRISGSGSWQQKTYALTSATNVLRWRYVKDSSASSGSDCGWVDQVVFAGSATMPVITVPPLSQVVTGGGSVTLSATATGTAPMVWQWFKDNAPLAGKTNDSIAFNPVNRSHSGQYVVIVTNVAGVATSQPPAVLRVMTPQKFTPPVRIGPTFRLYFGDEDHTPMDPGCTNAFEVWGSTNLAGSSWLRLTNPIQSSNGLLYLDDPTATNAGQKYYRIIER